MPGRPRATAQILEQGGDRGVHVRTELEVEDVGHGRSFPAMVIATMLLTTQRRYA
jgi:hypothetical protein